MPRTAAKVTQADIARALRAIKQSGMAMEVLIEADGRIRIVPTVAATVDSATQQGPKPKQWT